MRVPLSWLKELTPVSTDARDATSVAALGAVFDSLGLVVEATEQIGEGLFDVVLARVLDIAPIPKADRIRHITVDAGGAAPLEIVCGAWNFAVGDVVPLAPVGATLPNGMAIARREMRGVTSNGMLCSGRELGLSDDGAGLMVLGSATPDGALPSDLTPGMPLVDYLGIEADVVFDLAVEPNRPDCLSILGIARDVAARLRLPLEIPAPRLLESGPSVGTLSSLEVVEPELCRRMIARVFEGVAPVASSPAIARRLVLCGMRPLNAIVDVSNYVMLEFGQPSHPYDLDRLGGHGLRVRLARRGERLVTLDGEERILGEESDPFGARVAARDLLICDTEDTPVGLAGIMGGASSEIGEATTRVLLEVADFEPLTIGRSAARHNLRSEASARFWRGIDPAGLVRVADRFGELLAQELAKAGIDTMRVAAGVLESAPARATRTAVRVRPARVNTVLGTALSKDEIAAILSPIGFHGEPNGDALDVEIPSFRPDATREVDVIEEVARQFGYEQIARRQRRSPQVGRLSSDQARRRVVRRLLRGAGVSEALSSSIVAIDHAQAPGLVPVEITNPLTPNERALRTQLLPGLLQAIAANEAHRDGDLALFELGHVFYRPDGSADHVEDEQLAIVSARAGEDAGAAVQLVRGLLFGLGIAEGAISWRQSDTDGEGPLVHRLLSGLHPTRAALLVPVGGTTSDAFGALGEVDPAFLETFGLAGRRVGAAVFDSARLFSLARTTGPPRVPSAFPSSDIDLAFVTPETVSAASLHARLRAAAGTLCEWVRLIDVYRDVALGAGVRSLAYRLRFCAPDRTLTDGEVAEMRAGCITAAERELGVTLRA